MALEARILKNSSYFRKQSSLAKVVFNSLQSRSNTAVDSSRAALSCRSKEVRFCFIDFYLERITTRLYLRPRRIHSA